MLFGSGGEKIGRSKHCSETRDRRCGVCLGTTSLSIRTVRLMRMLHHTPWDRINECRRGGASWGTHSLIIKTHPAHATLHLVK